eukprot:CAMPEP_0119010150 /NCGR_PEP_ID=MMETSP1176-20130426/4827_1 /TAXON_ID=265551 /ORGANISM="Synedropsis recta cf, Strain CCMP1620" /LENGTH=171 /DNA_ID=CAMNT_0006962769 /DNA_START=283 /DNA_END=798 /DNA_ORIENTATION=-
MAKTKKTKTAPKDLIEAMAVAKEEITRLLVFDPFVRFKKTDIYKNSGVSKKKMNNPDFWMIGVPKDYLPSGEGKNYKGLPKSGYKAFLEHCKKEVSSENLIFYQRATDLERLVDDRKKYFAFFAEDIYPKHIAVDSAYEINLVAGSRNTLTGLYDDHKEEIQEAIAESYGE